MFTIQSRQDKARTGILKMQHGTVMTPAFAPVATRATVKTLTNEDLEKMGAQILMCNTYHLYLKPGSDLIERNNGLHNFMSWDKPIMTDSGGYQAFSLGIGAELGATKFEYENKIFDKKPRNAKVKEDGVEFKSIYDGSTHFFTPEKSIDIQRQLNSDMIFAFDECSPPSAEYDYTQKSMERTHRWLERCVNEKKTDQLLFGIIQGGKYQDLREQSAKFVVQQNTEGIGIGGSFGRQQMNQVLDWIYPYLPEEKPRHLLGIGTVQDIFEGVKRGMDLFDCVGPQMIARAGYIYILQESGGCPDNKFRYKVNNAKFKEDDRPLDPNCDCEMCKRYSRSYVHHLFKVKEYSAKRIATYHNLYYMLNLMRKIRKSIDDQQFDELYKKWMIQ